MEFLLLAVEFLNQYLLFQTLVNIDCLEEKITFYQTINQWVRIVFNVVLIKFIIQNQNQLDMK